jgi:hypothetical protein
METPGWAEGVDRLVSRLPGIVGAAALTINDARVIQFLADFWRQSAAGREETAAGLLTRLGPDPEWLELDRSAQIADIGSALRGAVAHYRDLASAEAAHLPPDGYYFNRPRSAVGQPVDHGFAGSKSCHMTRAGMVHVKPGCRCPKRSR